MSNKFSNIKERVLYLAENQEASKQTFFKKIGMTYGNFTGDAKKTPLNSTAIENILLNYPETNVEWLITGNGSMLKREPERFEAHHTDQLPGIPLIPEFAWAGISSGDVNVLELDCERYVVPNFKGADFLIPVKGSSMEPKYSSGDIVAGKWLPLDTFFQWNKVYVLDTIQGPLIKRVQKGDTDQYLNIISENPQYPAFQLPKTEIRKLALVLGVIRLE
jgi:repressor LexA